MELILPVPSPCRRRPTVEETTSQTCVHSAEERESISQSLEYLREAACKVEARVIDSSAITFRRRQYLGQDILSKLRPHLPPSTLIEAAKSSQAAQAESYT